MVKLIIGHGGCGIDEASFGEAVLERRVAERRAGGKRLASQKLISFENNQNRLAAKICIHQIGFPNDFSIRKEGGPPAFKSTPFVQ